MEPVLRRLWSDWTKGRYPAILISRSRGLIYRGVIALKIRAFEEAYKPLRTRKIRRVFARNHDCNHYVAMVIRDLACVDYLAGGIVPELRLDFSLEFGVDFR